MKAEGELKDTALFYTYQSVQKEKSRKARKWQENSDRKGDAIMTRDNQRRKKTTQRKRKMHLNKT